MIGIAFIHPVWGPLNIMMTGGTQIFRCIFFDAIVMGCINLSRLPGGGLVEFVADVPGLDGSAGTGKDSCQKQQVYIFCTHDKT